MTPNDQYPTAKIACQAYLGIICLAYLTVIVCCWDQTISLVSMYAYPFAASMIKFSFAVYVVLDTLFDAAVFGRVRAQDLLHHASVFATSCYYMNAGDVPTNVILAALGTTEVNTVFLYMSARASFSSSSNDLATASLHCDLFERTLVPFRFLNAMLASCIAVYYTSVHTHFSLAQCAWFLAQSLVPVIYLSSFKRKAARLRRQIRIRRDK